jgi:hypothetical protein
MKKLIMLSVLFLLVFSAIALADLSINSGNDVLLGGSGQERTVDDEPVYTQTTFTITNTENATVSGISVGSDVNPNYNVTFSGYTDGFNLTANASQLITVKAIVPEDFDAVDSEGKETSFDIGDIIVTSSIPEKRVNLSMQAENMLDFYRDEVTLEWDDEDEDVEDGEFINNIKPDDVITMTVKIENNYDDSGDYDFEIEDVEIELESSDDNEVDFDDDSYDLGDIKAEDDAETTFNIEVEDDADGIYTITIMVTGEDENGALHGAYMEFEIEVEKEDEDIPIQTAELLPDTISCDRTVKLETRIKNIGNDDSDEVVLLVECDELDIRERLINLDLNEDDDYDKTFFFNIGNDVDAGIYVFDITTYFDYDDYQDDDYNDVQNLLLTVRDCADEEDKEEDEEPTEEEEDEDDIVVQPTPGQTGPTGGVVYGQPVTKTESFLESNAYIALLAVGALIGIALLILAIAILVRS